MAVLCVPLKSQDLDSLLCYGHFTQGFHIHPLGYDFSENSLTYPHVFEYLAPNWCRCLGEVTELLGLGDIYAGGKGLLWTGSENSHLILLLVYSF